MENRTWPETACQRELSDRKTELWHVAIDRAEEALGIVRDRDHPTPPLPQALYPGWLAAWDRAQLETGYLAAYEELGDFSAREFMPLLDAVEAATAHTLAGAAVKALASMWAHREIGDASPGGPSEAEELIAQMLRGYLR